jgi:hypothetical protein
MKRKLVAERRLQDADAAVGVVLAAVIASLSVFGVVESPVTSAVILALLALLLTLFLRLRPAIRALDGAAVRQSERLRSLEDFLAGGVPTSSAFRYGYPDLQEDLGTAKAVLVVAGGSLRTTVGSFYHEFAAALERGASIRLLCPDPSDRTVMSLLASVQRSSSKDTADNVRASLRLAVRLKSLPAAGTLEIRTLRSLPSHGSIYIDAVDGHESLFVKLLTYGHSSGATPVFRLDRSRDSSMFALMLATTHAMWDDGTAVP